MYSSRLGVFSIVVCLWTVLIFVLNVPVECAQKKCNRMDYELAKVDKFDDSDLQVNQIIALEKGEPLLVLKRLLPPSVKFDWSFNGAKKDRLSGSVLKTIAQYFNQRYLSSESKIIPKGFEMDVRNVIKGVQMGENVGTADNLVSAACTIIDPSVRQRVLEVIKRMYPNSNCNCKNV